MEVVIAVHKADEASLRFVQGGVPGGAGTGVGLVNDPNAAVLLCPPIADFTAVVRRAVVYQEDFQVFIDLTGDGFQTPIQVFFHPVNRDNHRNQGKLFHIFSLY